MDGRKLESGRKKSFIFTRNLTKPAVQTLLVQCVTCVGIRIVYDSVGFLLLSVKNF